jgi:uncharacterized membrane protein YeaQ/YmgE (transglycosylase-associated protein family)
MDLIVSLVLGVVAGFLAVVVVYRTIPSSPMAWIGALLVGLLGGWIGQIVANLVGLEAVNWLGSLVIAFVAALGLLLALRKVAPAKQS